MNELLQFKEIWKMCAKFYTWSLHYSIMYNTEALKMT